MSVETSLPASIIAAFDGRPFLKVGELARALRMSPKTLLRHIAAGNIVGREIGLGTKRPRRVFTLSDVAVARFLERAPSAPPALSATRRRRVAGNAEALTFSAIMAERRSRDD